MAVLMSVFTAVIHCAVEVVVVIVMMGIKSGAHTKKFSVNGICGDNFRCSLAAQMAIEAKHFVSGRHHQVEIVGDH